MSYQIRIFDNRHHSDHSPLFRPAQQEGYAHYFQSHHYDQGRVGYSTSVSTDPPSLTSGLANMMARHTSNVRPENRVVDVRPWPPSRRVVAQGGEETYRVEHPVVSNGSKDFDGLQVVSHQSHPHPATQSLEPYFADGTICNYDSVSSASVRSASDRPSHRVSERDYGDGTNPYVTRARGGSQIGSRKATRKREYLPLQSAPLEMIPDDAEDLWDEIQRSLGPHGSAESTFSDLHASTHLHSFQASPQASPKHPASSALSTFEPPSDYSELDLTSGSYVGGFEEQTTATSATSWDIPHSEGVTPSATLGSTLTSTTPMVTSPRVHDELRNHDGIVPLEALVPPSHSLQIKGEFDDMDDEAGVGQGRLRAYGNLPGLTSQDSSESDTECTDQGGPRVLGWIPPTQESTAEDDDEKDISSEGGSPPPRRPTRRSRTSTRRNPRHNIIDAPVSHDSEGDSGDDSDVYQPSRSASLTPSLSNSSDTSVFQPREKKGRTRRSTAVTGSAALALIASKKEEDSSNDEFSEFNSRKRKNSVIPVPVPVPNLTKKSRGRKVPIVALPVASNDEEEGTTEEAHPPPKKRKKRGETASANDVRSFICPECGKCFVRGEHLKRHVRSIHTHDKPHVCPFAGCNKAFSRRDNLGQHVRVHLP